MKITKRQLNLIIENYLVTEVKAGTDRFSFKNSCDMSDIEFTRGFKAMKKFQEDKDVQATNKMIRKVEAEINNPGIDPSTAAPGAVDDFVSGKIAELEKHKKHLAELTKQKLGAFSGLTSPVFQKQLLQLLGFGMLVTMGPAANLYCDLLRSFVTVLNKAFDAAYGAEKKTEEFETIEFDFFYNALERVADPILRSLAHAKQEDVWNSAISELNISPNALSLFKYIYCVTGKKIDIKFPSPGGEKTIGSPRSAGYRDDVKQAAEVYLDNIKSGVFRIDGRAPVGSTSTAIKLKREFSDMIDQNPSRDELIKDLVNYINNRAGYGADGKASRSSFANLSQTIATKSAGEEDFYDNLIGHIKGTLNSVPG